MLFLTVYKIWFNDQNSWLPFFSHTASSAPPLTAYIVMSNRKTKDTVLVLAPSSDTIWCELKKKKKGQRNKYIPNWIHSNEPSSVTMEGHSSLLTLLPLHTILENYFGIAFKAICIFSVLSKFRFFFFFKLVFGAK